MATLRSPLRLFVFALALLAAASLGLPNPHDVAALADAGAPEEAPPAAIAMMACLDTHEPNDSILQARDISMASYFAYRYGDVYSYVCHGDTIDVWKFYVTAGDRIQLDLSNLPANYDLALWDYIPVLRAGSYNAGTSAEQIVYTAQTTGWWHAVVLPFDAAFDDDDAYHLEVRIYYATPTPTPTRTPTPTATPTCPDPYEPNDTFYEAWQLSMTTYAMYRYGNAYAYICHNDSKDFWKFYASEGEEIRVDLSSLPANYNLTLHDPLGTERSWSVNYGTAPDQIIRTADATGWWAAEVRPHTAGDFSNDDSYYLEVRVTYAANTSTPTPTATRTPTRTPTRTATPVCPDPYEPNDTFATAIEIPMTTYIAYRYGHVYSYYCVGDSYDYWKFYVNDGEVIRLTLTNQGPYRSFDVLLYEPSNSFVTGRSGEPIDFDYVAHVTGWWRARVETWVGSDQDAYHLEVRVYTAWDTVTPTHTATRTPTFGATATRTMTPTVTRTPTLTLTGTATLTLTRTHTRTLTKTPTPTLTRTRTPTSTATYTSRPANTAGPSPTWVAGARKRLWLPALFTQ